MVNSTVLKLNPFSFILIFCLIGCNEDDPLEDTSFDRSTMLTSLADDLIIPNFESLQTSVNALSQSASVFEQNPTGANLLSLREAWAQAVEDYQHCSAFGFGPGTLILGSFSSVLGVFPVDEDLIESNMTNENFNLEASFDRDIRGFYAVEYLIYGKGESDEELIANFDQNRFDYLFLIISELKVSFDAIVSEWNTTYRDEFISNDGTSAGSSVSLLYNEFVKDYENLKNFKVELPAGLTAGQIAADPTLVEAYYSGISRSLIELHFESSKNIWSGTSKGGVDLIGFEEYLEAVEGGPELIQDTRAAISDIDQAIENLPQGRLSDHVSSQELENLRDLLQANTANFKSSMSSLLGINITFNSGDGD